jgi:multidrug resistance efflux pump
VKTGAGDSFALQKAETDLRDLEAQYASAVAAEGQVRARQEAQVDGDIADVAEIKAKLANARWELQQTTTVAPADGWVINLQLRPGSFVAPLAQMVALTFVEDEFQVIAMYNQNELYKVEPGNEAEFSLPTMPGQIIKAKVESIVWAQGQGQIAPSGVLPGTGTVPMQPGRFAVKLGVAERHSDAFFAAGAVGHGAIYTNHGKAIQILRKVFLRVSAKLDYIIAKLH